MGEERNWSSLGGFNTTEERKRRYDEFIKVIIELNDKPTHETFQGWIKPYIGCALTYFVLGNRQKAYENIHKIETISDCLEAKYYKEILGF